MTHLGNAAMLPSPARQGTHQVAPPPDSPAEPVAPSKPAGEVRIFLPMISKPSGLRYQVGKAYLYQYSSVIRGQSNSSGTEGAQTTSNVLTATMTAKFTPLEAQANGSWLIEMHVESPRFVYKDESGAVQDKSDPDMERDLVRSSYFYQFPDGKVGGIRYDPKDAKESINLKRGLISSLQTQLARNAGENFAAAGLDVSGQFNANYAVATQGTSLVISRTRTQDDYAASSTDITDTNDGKALINDNNVTVFDVAQGIITSTSSSTLIAASDGLAPAGPTDTGTMTDTNDLKQTDGITESYGSHITTQSLAQSSMTLDKVVTADPMSLPDATYVSDDLMAEPPPPVTQTIDLSQTMVNLLANPGLPATLDEVILALKVKPETHSLLRNLLQTEQKNQALMQTVMGALASDGSEASQQILIEEIVLGEAASDDLKVLALGNLSAVRKPSPLLLATLEKLAADSPAALRPQVMLVWGAMADKLSRSNPGFASKVVASLEIALSHTTDDQEISYLLGGLGNTGSAAALPSISRQLASGTSFIKVSAIDALRKMPASANTLLEGATTDKSPLVQESAYLLLKQRVPASPNARWAYWWWSRRFGGGDFYADLYAYVRAEQNPDVWARAVGEASAGVFGRYLSILKGEAITDLVNANQRRFAAFVWLLGNKVIDRSITVTCGNSSSGRLVGYSLRFFDFDKTFFVGPVPVNLRVVGSGNFAVDYSFAWNACNAPVLARASVQLTPRVWVRVTGYAGVNLLLVRGGIGAEVNLMNLSLPVRAEATVRNTTPIFTGCLNISTQLQPASGSLFLWYQTWAVRWPPWDSGWGSEHRATLWSFGSATYNWTIVNQCFNVN